MTRFRQNPRCAATILGGEAAVVTPDSRMHVLTDVATRIWELCADDGMTQGELVERLVSEFEAARETVEAETIAFLDEAAAAGLVVRD